MEVTVSALPEDKTTQEVEEFFLRHLRRFNIAESDCIIECYYENWPTRSARIQISNKARGSQFIHASPLQWGDFAVHMEAGPINEWSKQFQQLSDPQTPQKLSIRSNPTSIIDPFIPIQSLMAGIWDYSGDRLQFSSHYRLPPKSTTVSFGPEVMVVFTGNFGDYRKRIDVAYRNCENIVIGDVRNLKDLTISFTLKSPPEFYLVPPKDNSDERTNAALCEMGITSDAWQGTGLGRNIRLPGIDKEHSGIDKAHSKVVSECLVYRITFLQRTKFLDAVQLLEKNARLFSAGFICRSTIVREPFESLEKSWSKLNYELTDENRLGNAAFGLRFQLHRLSSNSKLPPYKVLEIIPKVKAVLKQYGSDITISALCRFYTQLPLSGPGTDATSRSRLKLEALLEDCAAQFHQFDNLFALAKLHKDRVLIHRVIVTPTSIRLGGPELESSNEMLRKYSDHADDFIRVQFEDEDGSQVRGSGKINPNVIFHDVFESKFAPKESGWITIAGRNFEFLGYSHSSLRAQTCWFMSWWVLTHAVQVLKGLGDFSHIRSPAKCAARIGQNFTDTTAAFELEASMIGVLPAVERNGFEFSDGCGTISEELLREVWKKYGKNRALKPVALQIRVHGAKGIVSLDPRLQGKKIMLRESMIKYSSNALTLGVCNAAFAPIPTVLNPQYIKILEDLKVPSQVFLDIQDAEVNRLRKLTDSPIETAKLLDENSGIKATGFPLLIRSFAEIGLDCQQDRFISSV